MPHLKILRELRQFTPSQLAEAAGLSVQTYYDLEAHPDDLRMCISLKELFEICATLSVSPGELLSLHDNPGTRESPKNAGILCEMIRDSIQVYGLTIEAAGEKVGWELQKVLNDPDMFCGDFNADGLADVCEFVQVNLAETLNNLMKSEGNGETNKL